MSLPVVGATISLISKSNIRFVGILFNINHEESSISLQNVRSFGTEGRAKRPEDEIPPQPNTFPLIVFKGSDVKDLKVEDNNSSAMPQFGNQVYPGMPNGNPYYAQQHMAYMQQMYWQQPGYQYPTNQFGMGFNEPINPAGFSNNATGFANNMPGLAPGFASPQGFANNFNQPIKAEAPRAAPLAKPKEVDQLASKLSDVKVTPNVNIQKKKPTSALQVNKPGEPIDLKVEKQRQVKKENKTVLNFSEFDDDDNEPTSSKKKPQPKTAWQNKPQQNGEKGQKSQSKSDTKQKKAQSKPSDEEAETMAEIKDGPKETQPKEGQPKENKRDNQRQDKRNNKKQGKKITIPSEEFDFESSNAKFEKTDLDSPLVEKTYSKSSFFDDISCETKDRLDSERVDMRSRRQEERSLNMETFGQAEVRHNWRGRGRGRGRNDRQRNRRPEGQEL